MTTSESLEFYRRWRAASAQKRKENRRLQNREASRRYRERLKARALRECERVAAAVFGKAED